MAWFLSALGTAGSTVGSAASTVGGALAKGAGSVGTALGQVGQGVMHGAGKEMGMNAGKLSQIAGQPSTWGNVGTMLGKMMINKAGMSNPINSGEGKKKSTEEMLMELAARR